jgi:hypothetical protein
MSRLQTLALVEAVGVKKEKTCPSSREGSKINSGVLASSHSVDPLELLNKGYRMCLRIKSGEPLAALLYEKKNDGKVIYLHRGMTIRLSRLIRR